jgi:hypothetical protein
MAPEKVVLGGGSGRMTQGWEGAGRGCRKVVLEMGAERMPEKTIKIDDSC